VQPVSSQPAVFISPPLSKIPPYSSSNHSALLVEIRIPCLDEMKGEAALLPAKLCLALFILRCFSCSGVLYRIESRDHF
jgi:hypothetical protein